MSEPLYESKCITGDTLGFYWIEFYHLLSYSTDEKHYLQDGNK